MKRFFTVSVIFFLALTAAFGQFRKSRDKSTQPITDTNLNYANPAEYYIGGIDVTGLNVLDKNAMISLTGLKIGDKIKIPGDQISGAVRKLWKHGLVGDVQILVEKIEGQNVFLIVKLSERPRLTEYYFTGISKGRQSTLKEDLTLIKGKIVNDAMIRNTELTVRKTFTKKGFLNTTVKVYQELDTLNRGGIRLRIDVDLKTKVRINEILFEGNNNISSSKLKKPLKKTHEHARITLHRVLLGMLLDFKPRKVVEVLDSSYAVSWREVKEFVNRNVKLNFISIKFGAYEF